MNDKSIIAKANKAQALLNDPLLIDAFENVREALLKNIEDAPIRDQEGVHELKLMLKLLKDVRAAIESHINDGKVIINSGKKRFSIFNK